MLGLALEGGGAKGAYEIGAYRALTELGYRFDVICGVSIGAINAALLAQGDCERAAEFWETMSNDDLFSEKDRGFLEVINRQVNLNTLSALKANIKTALENGGIDTSRIRAFLEQNIDPRRLLDSPVDYGMIAVAFPELQPLIAYKKDMTPETVIDHVLASASFPGFQPTVIGDKKYLDGGLYDACPYNELLDYGCDEVIAIRLNGFGIIHPVRDRSKIRQIFPSEQLGPVMRFDPANSRRNIQMGYYDTLRQLQGLPGRMYYFSQKADGFAVFAALPDDAIRTVAGPLRVPEELPPRRALFEHILPDIAAELRLPKDAGYDDLLLALLEHRAEQLGVGRFRWYTPAELQTIIAEQSPLLPEEPRRRRLRSRPEEAAELLAAALPVLGK